ncbi:MAG: protein phosphatase 2C domain-containing protein [Nibricoccus sp.]
MQAPVPSQPPFPCQLVWSGMTHRGRVRANNEDSFLALTFDGHHVNYLGKIGEAPLANMDFVFAVSDGMGGANSGEFASKIAVEKITRLLPRSFRMGAQGGNSDFADILPEVFSAIHQEMIQLDRSYEECAGMGATLSLCWFTPGWMYFGHIGDSRIYYLPKIGGFSQITHDHTHVGWLRRKGRINEREARAHPQRNSLNQALGAGNQIIDPHVGAVGTQPGDRFLICSDGLTDGLWDRRIEEILRSNTSIHDLARTIVEESVQESGRDNTTAVIVEVLALPSASPI